MIKSALSVPDSYQVPVSFALYVDTAVWFSASETAELPETTGSVSSTSVTVTVTAKASLTFPALSVAISDTLYSLLLSPALRGFSKSGGEINVNTPEL